MQRLKTGPQFQAVMAAPPVSRSAHFALHRLSLLAPTCTDRPDDAALADLFSVQGPWIGAVVPKRWARRAVTRNAIKRQIYAVSASLEPSLPIAAHVVRLRSGFDRTLFVSATSPALKRAVREELSQLFSRATR